MQFTVPPAVFSPAPPPPPTLGSISPGSIQSVYADGLGLGWMDWSFNGVYNDAVVGGGVDGVSAAFLASSSGFGAAKFSTYSPFPAVGTLSLWWRPFALPSACKLSGLALSLQAREGASLCSLAARVLS